MTLTFTTITHDEALAFILGGIQAKRAEIDATLRDLRSQLHTPKPEPPPHSWLTRSEFTDASPHRKRRKMSAATRKRMAEAQRARWAKVRG